MHIKQSIIESIKNGAVGVMPTDTVYGVVASINHTKSIERIYDVKGRPSEKRLIYLISGYDQLKLLGITISDKQRTRLDTLWPGRISVDLKCDDTKPFIHAGKYSVAVRIPDLPWLRNMLIKTGPLGSTSANIAGEPYIPNISKIKKALPDLDFFIEGTSLSTPSRLASVHEDGSVSWIERK